MNLLPFLALLLAAPFWEAKAPAEWSDLELQALLTESPWAQLVSGPGTASPAPPVQVYLATAAPMELALEESARRARLHRKPGQAEPPGASEEEYRAWLQENRAQQIVLAVGIGDKPAFSDEREVKRMEQECVMRVGRRKFKLTGHFPPSAGDPVLRLAFPREVQPEDKTVSFDLYLPGLTAPYRLVEFRVKDMLVHGRLEM